MTTAPCYGKPDLFESVYPNHHLEAKKFCDTCPVIDTCRKLRDTRNPGSWGDPMPTGTWAGELWNNGRRLKVAGADVRTDGTRTNTVKSCADCHLPIKRSQKRCTDCQRLARLDQKARYDKGRTPNRGPELFDLTHPCLRCGAKAGEGCVTANGNKLGHIHVIRAGKTCATCPTAVDGRNDYCDACRVEARRAQCRESNARKAAKKTAA